MKIKVIFSAARLMLLAFVMLGLVYSIVVLGIGELFFPYQANGSLITYNHKVIGSDLIGQSFTSKKYFQGRPSATTPAYNASASAASNYGPTNPLLLKEIKTNLSLILKENPGVSMQEIPPQLVESSASGLDPDISPVAAYLQVPRVARLNHISSAKLRKYIRQTSVGRFLGIFGTPYVNVLNLNIEVLRLDKKK